MVHHGVDGPDRQPLAERLLDVDQQHRQAVRTLLDLVEGGRAHQQRHEIGMARARGPDFLSVYDIMIAVLDRHGSKLQGVRAGRRLSDAEGLEADVAGCDLRQIAVLLRVRPMPHQHGHHVHLGVAGERIAARSVDLLEDHATGPERQARAAILFGDERGQIARVRHLLDEGVGIGGRFFQLPPVGAGILRADRANAFANLEEILADRNHGLRVLGVGRHFHRPYPLYLPLKSGRRFSLKARTPSRRSSVEMVRS